MCCNRYSIQDVDLLFRFVIVVASHLDSIDFGAVIVYIDVRIFDRVLISFLSFEPYKFSNKYYLLVFVGVLEVDVFKFVLLILSLVEHCKQVSLI